MTADPGGISPEDFLWLYIPCPDRDTAIRIGRTLVADKLIACANVSPSVTSIYEWENEIKEEQETLLIAKTRKALFAAVQKKVEALHPYSCPCIVGLPLAAGNDPYLRWMSQVTLEG